jgi:hypothetical protein
MMSKTTNFSLFHVYLLFLNEFPILKLKLFFLDNLTTLNYQKYKLFGQTVQARIAYDRAPSGKFPWKFLFFEKENYF